jgi:hypothetical protein
VAQVVVYLPSKREALSSKPQYHYHTHTHKIHDYSPYLNLVPIDPVSYFWFTVTIIQAKTPKYC